MLVEEEKQVTEFIASLMIEKEREREKVEQEMHFKRCDMNYALDLLREKEKEKEEEGR